MTKDNLTIISEARTELNVATNKEIADFYSFFVGALQSHIPTEEWANAVAIAKDCYRCTRVISSV